MAVTNINQTSEQFVESFVLSAKFQIILHKSVGGQKLCGETQVCIHNMVGGGQFIRGGGEGDWKTTICQRLGEGLQPAFGRYNMDGDLEIKHSACPRLAEAVQNQKNLKHVSSCFCHIEVKF